MCKLYRSAAAAHQCPISTLKLATFLAISLLVGSLSGAVGYSLWSQFNARKLSASTVFSNAPTVIAEDEVASTPTPLNSELAAGSEQSARTHPQWNRFSYHDGISRVAPSVVSLYSSETVYRAPITDLLQDSINPRIAPAERRATSQGSGVIIGPDGLIVTNNHLVEAADQIYVVLSDGSLHQGKVIGSDPETDLAVVRIPAGGLPAAPVADNLTLRVGDIVLAIGNPFGVGQTVTQGIVSATRRQVAGSTAWQNFVQIDAAINPGNSGGALITPDGNLVGINTSVFMRDSGAEGIGFAIPASLLEQVVPQIIEHGRVIRGWLGIDADELPMFPAVNELVDSGAVITGVLPSSPADIGGLRRFDVVGALNGEPILNARELLLKVSSQPPGSVITLSINRGGAMATLQVELGERPRLSALDLR